jgi:hypothetical protein
MQCVRRWMVAATVAAICCGCGPKVSVRHPLPAAAKAVALAATQDELLEKYNAFARGVKTLNATVVLKPTAGSTYSGVIEEYHDVKAFLLAARPASVRMIGQAPVISKTVFDMTSDGETFRVSIPSKNKFLVGPVGVEKTSSKPIENLRPQHLLDALLWPEIRKGEATLFEEFNDEMGRFYVLTVLRGGYQTEILRKIWFDRSNLQVVQLEGFGPKGALLSDVHLTDWQPVDAGTNPASSGGATSPSSFARSIRIDRPHDDYKLEMQVTKITLNEEIPAERFKLEQPPGSELVRVGDGDEQPKAKEPGKP